MRGRIAPLLLTVAAALLLAGCSGTSTSETDLGVVDQDGISVEGGAPAVSGEVSSEELAATDRVANSPTTVTTDRQVIRTGYMNVRVEDVTKSAFDVHGLITKHQGLISSEDVQSSGDYTYANITAQIPAAALDAYITDVSRLGDVDSINITAQDVTSQVVDLDARIKALQTSIDRMTQLLAEAVRIEDLLAIETQLSQRQAELDALTAQRTWLGDQVAMSTITVSLSPVTTVTEVDAPGFVSGLQSGWAAFVSVIMVAVTALGFFLPFLMVLLVIAIPVAVIVARQVRRNRRDRTQQTDIQG